MEQLRPPRQRDPAHSAIGEPVGEVEGSGGLIDGRRGRRGQQAMNWAVDTDMTNDAMVVRSQTSSALTA